MNSHRKTSKNVIALGCRTLLAASFYAPALVLAASPIAFDGWQVNNGVIDTSASCSGNITCTTLVEDDGFLQQQVVTPQGTFFRTIMTDAGASGQATALGFATETFIPQNKLTDFDMTTKQAVRDPANGFNTTAIIDREPFLNTQGQLVNPISIELQQTLASQDINSSFHLLKNEAVIGTDMITGKSMDISQIVTGATANSADGYQQLFDQRERTGWQISRVNDDLVIDPFAPADSMTLDNQQIAWQDGDSVKSLWIAMRNDELASSGTAIQRIENLTQNTSARIVALEADAVLDPFDWNTATLGAPPPSLP